MNNDLIREKVLEALYSILSKAKGRDSQMVGIRDLSAEVKIALPNIKMNQIAANVTFLVQNNFVEEVEVKNFFAQGKFGNSKPSIKYRLSREGLAYFEHGSKFDKSNTFAGIVDITGSGNNIIIGNQNSVTNIVNTQFTEGHKLAEDLRRRVNALGVLSDDEKVSVQSDLETIKSQLAKKDPDKDILKKSKDNLGILANITAVAPYAIQLFTWLSTQFHF
jgi:hypothetical protein